MEKVKLGLIGAGNMGAYHANNIKTIDEIELVAVCDGDKQKAEQLA